jgi:hypothetical protein
VTDLQGEQGIVESVGSLYRRALIMEVRVTTKYRRVLPLSILVIMAWLSGCQRETPVEKSQASQQPSVVDQAVRQSVDAIQTPMDKARGVEGALNEAAGRTADRVQEGTP